MTKNNLTQANDLLNPADPEVPKILIDDEALRSARNSRRSSTSVSVIDQDNISVASGIPNYEVTETRWIILWIFVVYSASNSMQWTQYTIIQDIVMKYYGVSGNLVSWTSMIYMITYIPLILVESWFLDKTVSDLIFVFTFC